ncbi:leukocyte tyrosine kinase receptor [Exaiptasia diaphana]|uniref:receptor protein-tyrosine kinase n=1 Tax=Exaiptasia diaphana TaxID=2652724 RepID=A0A913YUS3_EXADI|nr:leukocyte tyrosine kinase receptor [Exaiptasia diaphana]XP_028519256.1 leukocyte tyrosine kinase receptor [Exaiptasia diaphana]
MSLSVTSRWIVLIKTIVVVSGVTRSTLEKSSYVETKTNFVLLHHVFQSLRTASLMTCAQMCLGKPRCQSFNFETNFQAVNAGLCELNDFANDAMLIYQKGFIHGWLTDLQLQTFLFTSLGASGSKGPTNTTQYSGSNLQGQVQLVKGTQLWTIPQTGKYVIKANGASGGNGTSSGCGRWTKGGRGASITGTFSLQKGNKLKIIVGQQGLTQLNFPVAPGGGGGGTFVTLSDNTPLIIAAGGGGGGVACRQQLDGDPGQAGPNGTRGGGSGGSGGKVENLDANSQMLSNSGAGYTGDGTQSSNSGKNSKSFIHGGHGGSGISETGGFGGGGYGWTHAGGGGGYSGGGVIGNETYGVAGGGGSFNGGSSQENEVGINQGDGRVIIKYFS